MKNAFKHYFFSKWPLIGNSLYMYGTQGVEKILNEIVNPFNKTLTG